jgi:hypothetical protein
MHLNLHLRVHCETVDYLERKERLGNVGHYVAGCIIYSLLPYFLYAYIHWMHFKLTRLPHTLSLEDYQVITLQII